MTRQLELAGAALAVAAAFGAGWYLRPVRVEDREVVRYVDRTVTEWRDRVVTLQGPVRTVERIVERPGGERVTERAIEAAPVRVETVRQGSQEAARAAQAERTHVEVATRPRVRLDIGATLTGGAARRWDAAASVRLGPVWVGVADQARQEEVGDLRRHAVGLRIGLEF